MIRRRIQRRGAQERECLPGITARAYMNFELACFEVGEPRFDVIERNAADPSREEMAAQSFIAKCRDAGDVLRARPTVAVVQSHSVESTAGEKQTAAVAERKMPYRPPQHEIGVRHPPGRERAIQPRKRRRG